MEQQGAGRKEGACGRAGKGKRGQKGGRARGCRREQEGRRGQEGTGGHEGAGGQARPSASGNELCQGIYRGAGQMWGSSNTRLPSIIMAWQHIAKLAHNPCVTATDMHA
jgi:hypothetical protein